MSDGNGSSRRRWLYAGLVLIPLADILLLVWVAGRIGAVPTVAMVVLTALIGLMLVRAEGRHTLRELQRQAASGELPTDPLLDGALIVAAGAFLLTPGLVTDLVGLLLVLPVTRPPIRAAIKRWVVVPWLERETGGFVSGNVYVGGFPFGRGDDWPGEAQTGGSGGDTVDLGPDAYHIDVEDADDDRPDGAPNGNA